MPNYTGLVFSSHRSYRFRNDDGTPSQRLTLAKLSGDLLGQEIDLKPYEGKQIDVEGEWEHDWIVNVQSIRIFGQDTSIIEAKENRRASLIKLLAKYNLAGQTYGTDFDKTEFLELMMEFGYLTAKDKYCSCNNGYACNPSSPPPNCGACTCVDIP